MDNILASNGRNEGQQGGMLTDFFLDTGFLLYKKEKNDSYCQYTYGHRSNQGIRLADIHVDCVAKIAELELDEKEKMKEKIKLSLKYNSTIFINR
ncbi:T-complex protein 1 subunit beta [Daphnia magna]|uniref:T-complex protein 1 subunit beta n=1 Tax=Daphnia magna TaxID=35525 RepID=UPI001403F619|nr:T-complex protein 1 subunit beta [Daphnia magna]